MVFAVLITELWSLYQTISDRIIILLGVIFCDLSDSAAHLRGGLLRSTKLVVASPFGFFPYYIQNETLSVGQLAGLLSYHVLLCAIPAVLVYRRLSSVRNTRILLAAGQ